MENLNSIFHEKMTLEQINESDKIYTNLAKKYLNQNRARTILYNHEISLIESAKTLDGKPLYAHLTDLEKRYKAANAHNTIKCLRVKRRSADHVSIRVDHKNNKAHFGGTQQCGSPWVCHPCATKINIRRTVEIQKAFKWAYQEEKLQVMMLTLTFPHAIDDSLVETMAKMKLAMKLFRKGGNYDDYKDFVLYHGMIKRVEVTWSFRNGWHPHSHELHFIRNNLTKKEQKRVFEMILKKWENACIEAGLLKHGKIMDFRKHAVDIVFNAKSSDYIAKIGDMDEEEKAEAIKKAKSAWGADKEITSTNTKVTKLFGHSPWFLLENSEKNPKYRELWLEYALAMKGKTQLLWSPGLKAKVGVSEKKDKDIVEEQNSTSDILALFTDDQWKIILNVDKEKNKKDDRAEICWLAVNCGFDGLARYFKNHGSILADVDSFNLDENIRIYETNQGKKIERAETKKEKKPKRPIVKPTAPPAMSADEIIKKYEENYIKDTTIVVHIVDTDKEIEREKWRDYWKKLAENQKFRHEFNTKYRLERIVDMDGNITEVADIPLEPPFVPDPRYVIKR